MVGGATVSYVGCNPPDSVGIPMAKTDCKIVAPGTTDELTYYQEGEICFSGDTMMIGYYNKEEATRDIIKLHSDGKKWLHTGDLGHLDKDGILYVTGRIKRIIMTKGNDGQVTKMFPDRIEKAIHSDESVEICCVVGIPDEARINYPKAIVVLKKGYSADENTKQKIIESCRAFLAEYMVPDEIEFRDDLPRTPRGKVDYRALEKEIS
jgi:long-chain acyl-CoA synthetase